VIGRSHGELGRFTAIQMTSAEIRSVEVKFVRVHILGYPHGIDGSCEMQKMQHRGLGSICYDESGSQTLTTYLNN